MGSLALLVFGKAMTSRMESLRARSITRRSKPSAMPPCGGAPSSSARMRWPNFSSISSSVSPTTRRMRRCSSALWMRIVPPPTSKPSMTKS